MTQTDERALFPESTVLAVVDLPTAAAMLGIGRTLAYELVRTGRWPTPVLRMGRLIKIPTQALLDLVSAL